MAQNRTGRGLAVIACAATLFFGAAVQASEAPVSFSPIAKELLPAVVDISSKISVGDDAASPFAQLPPGHPLREFFDRFQGQQGGPGGGLEGAPEGSQAPMMQSMGSGFIIHQDGFIVTNDHVVSEANEVTVRLSDEQEYKAKVIGTDPRTDIALLKVDANKALPTLEWGDSETMEVGDWVLAIGTPFGLGGSVTAGIVSSRGRDIDAGPYSRFIQTDAAMNRGNSGGPLVDTEGHVVGVNTAILSPSGGNIGVGFALPSRVARPIVEELMEKGKVTRGWLGVAVQPVTPAIADGLDLPERIGALVGSTVGDAPAAKAGIEQGDVIIRVDEQTIKDAGQLAWTISQRDPGEEVEVEFWRDGEKMTKAVTLGELSEEKLAEAGPTEKPEMDEASMAVRALGIQLAAVQPQMLQQFDLPDDTKGAIVARVAIGGPAAESGIRPGHVIKQVGRTKVDGPEAVNKALESLAKRGASGVVLLVQDGDQAQFVSVPLATPQAG